jgi:type II secretory pathway component PulF
MPVFFYKAKKGLSDTIEGAITADTRDEALAELLEKGLFPISIGNAADNKKEQPTARKTTTRFRKRITSGDILNFTQKLSTLIRASVDLLAALKIIYDQVDRPVLKELILGLRDTIKEGGTFSEALSRYPKVFFPLFIALVRTGESTGRIDSALEEVTLFLQRQEALKNKVAVALAYPVLLVIIGLTSIFVIINFVIPRLKPIFEGLMLEPPFITRFILNISAVSSRFWFIFLGLPAVFFVFLFYNKQARDYFYAMLNGLKNKLPLIKKVSKNQELAFFSSALNLLLKSGVPALQSLKIAADSLSTPALKQQIQSVCQAVSSGESISKSMEDMTSLPKFFISMVAVGEQSSLDRPLEELAKSYAQAVEKDVGIITSLLEPVLILVLGLILGTIVLAILLPIFQITQMVH